MAQEVLSSEWLVGVEYFPCLQVFSLGCWARSHFFYRTEIILCCLHVVVVVFSFFSGKVITMYILTSHKSIECCLFKSHVRVPKMVYLSIYLYFGFVFVGGWAKLRLRLQKLKSMLNPASFNLTSYIRISPALNDTYILFYQIFISLTCFSLGWRKLLSS